MVPRSASSAPSFVTRVDTDTLRDVTRMSAPAVYCYQLEHRQDECGYIDNIKALKIRHYDLIQLLSGLVILYWRPH